MKIKLFAGLAVGILALGLAGIANATLITYQPGATGIDAHISGDANQNSNFGTYDYLTVNWFNSNPDSGLIKFDLSALSGANIISADLSLYHIFNNVNGASVGLYRNLADWDESTVTWNTAPSYNVTPVSVLNIADSNDGIWRSWDVTSVVQDWVSGVYDNYGLRVSRTDQANSFLYLLSSDYADADLHPMLTIEYADPIPEPATMLLLGTGLVGVAGAARRRKKNQA